MRRYRQMLSEAQVRNAKSSGRPVKIADGGGFYLAAMLNGGRYWRFDYRFLGSGKPLPRVPIIN